MTVDHVTNTAALGAVGSPWWLPSLQTVSDSAALVLPILGVTWLLVQIGAKLYVTLRKT